MVEINAQYNVARPDSLAVKIAAFARRKMYSTFMKNCKPDADDLILDIGVTSDRTYEASNYLEAWYPHKSRVTAAGVDDASFLEEIYPGMQFVNADARDLPFPDSSFDYVHSSAVLEHVGSRMLQGKMISEVFRVARKGVFLTTPNRWFPIEFHSILPLVHWLPPRFFRDALTRLGHTELASEDHLNLLGKSDLNALCRTVLPNNAEYQVRSIRLGGWPSNLMLIIRKDISA